MNGKDVVFYIDGKPIPQDEPVSFTPKYQNLNISISSEWTLDADTELKQIKPFRSIGWEFYMRRGDRHYFRNAISKIVVTEKSLREIPLKYGDIADMTFE